MQDSYYGTSTCPPFDPSAAPGGGDGSVTLESLGGVFQVLVLFQVTVLSMYILVRNWPEWLSERLCPARAALLSRRAGKENFAMEDLATRSPGTKTQIDINPMHLSSLKARSTVRDVMRPKATHH